VLGSPTWSPVTAASLQAVLLGGLARPYTPGRDLERPAERPRQFADAGLALLRSRPKDGPELWCRCDGGPHGFLSIAAHAHADALSVEVRHDGVPLLVDPGTYCYHGEPEWRQYFRSTAAHNTLEVAGLDQSDSGGPFMWRRHARTRVLCCDAGAQPVQTWSGEHDGYLRLDPPVVHRRSVVLDSPARTLTITDTLETTESVALRLCWHLGPLVSVQLDGVGAEAELAWEHSGTRRTARLSLPGALAWSHHRGETAPIMGWYSPAFGSKVPSSTLIGSGTATSDLTHVLRFGS
jgi:hypothetical protein